jgi:general stress protein YciG
MTRGENMKRAARTLGKMGGRARADKLTAEQRSEIARKGGKARQAKWRATNGQ